MEESIRQFHTQFGFEPVLKNGDSLARGDKFIVCGMGGSALGAGLVRVYNPTFDLLVHRDYGLPRVPEYFLRESRIIASSYSGNTEETIDAFESARRAGLDVAAVTTGGALLQLAERTGVPHIVLPQASTQPRMALGWMLKALLTLFGDEAARREVGVLAETLDPNSFEEEGRALAEALVGFVPVIYASNRNLPLAYTWKITFNETGKIPAFYNVLPELNHNEMTGFDMPHVQGGTTTPTFSREALNRPFAFLFLKDESDDQRILRRMEFLEKLYRERSLPVETLELSGASPWEKIFSSLLLADWTALYSARMYGLEDTEVPMVEEFKRRMSVV